MALGSGLAAQIGYGVESTAGTVVTPTFFVPLVSESLGQERARLEAAGIIAGRRVLDSDMWNGGPVTVAGDVQHELYDVGMGSLLKAMFGTSVTTGSGPYTHTFTPGGLEDNSLTAQVGRPATDGTVYPFTYGGMKVDSWEIACSAGEIATVGLSFVGMSEQAGSRTVADGVTTNASTAASSASGAFTDADIGKSISGTGIPAGTTIASVTSSTAIVLSAAATADGTGLSFVIGKALATASYASAKPVKFNHGVVTIGGSAVQVKAATVAGNNGLTSDRLFLGSKNHATPLEAALREYTGSLDVEFTDLTQYNRYLAGDAFAIVLAFTVGANTLTITTKARYEPGITPNVGGPGILEQTLGFKCFGDTDAEAITAVLVNTDATV